MKLSNQNRDIEIAVMQELLRQVRLSYNLALGVTAASALVTIGGVGLLYFNKIPEASVTAAGGVLASVSSVQFAKETKEELRDALDELQKQRL